MRLYDNWKEIVRRSWAQRFVILAALFVAGSEVFQLFSDVIPRYIYAPTLLALLVGAFVSRIVFQSGI